jgi:YHYH protein
MPRLKWPSAAIAVLALAGCGGAAAIATSVSGAKTTAYATTPTSPGPINPAAVPLGDGYVSTTPKVGYVDSCVTHFGSIGGARTDGPWIDAKTHTWDYDTKLTVNGRIHWPEGSYEVTIVGDHRVIKFNDLPRTDPTGIFPIESSDPAYEYDQNGNHIAKQSFDWKLPLHPKAAKTPGCTPGGPIGVLKDGVALFNALDGEGRDAGAHEVLDVCAGHPDPSDTYHHHDVPACILNKVENGTTQLVGYALDGYGIYVVKNKAGELPTNTQLDACHGTTSRVLWDGRMTRIYHYVATLEYPYTVGCFHGTAIASGHGSGGAKSGSGGSPGGSGGPPGGGPPAA